MPQSVTNNWACGGPGHRRSAAAPVTFDPIASPPGTELPVDAAGYPSVDGMKPDDASGLHVRLLPISLCTDPGTDA